MTKNIENFSFNKAIANLYDLTNIISKATVNPFTKRKALKSLAVLMMPFTPHIAEEMWLTLGGQGLISQSSWPNVNQELLENEDITIAVQINGKRRTLITYPKSLEKKEIESLALSNENIKKILGGKDPKKVIVIPGPPSIKLITAPQFRESELSCNDKSTFLSNWSSRTDLLN